MYWSGNIMTVGVINEVFWAALLPSRGCASDAWAQGSL